jgi:hypothetical protein
MTPSGIVVWRPRITEPVAGLAILRLRLGNELLSPPPDHRGLVKDRPCQRGSGQAEVRRVAPIGLRRRSDCNKRVSAVVWSRWVFLRLRPKSPTSEP